MKALLLSAGYGRRLRPLTVGRAKPALPLLDRPLILYTLDRLKEASVEEVFVNLHHLPETVEEVLSSYVPEGIEVTFCHEPKILGTGGALKSIRGLLDGEDHFLLVNGDSFFGFSFRPIIETHRASGAVATMALRPYPQKARYSRVTVGRDGRVAAIGGRPPRSPVTPEHDRMFVGLHCLSKEIWPFLPDRETFGINADIYPKVILAGQEVRGLDVRGTWHDIGTPVRYLAANLDLLHDSDLMVDADRFPEVRLRPPVYAGEGVSVGDDCILEDGVVLGRGTQVGESTILARVVTLDGAIIGNRCTIRDAVIGPGVTIPADSDLDECVVFPYRGHEAVLRRREVSGDNVVASFSRYDTR